MEKKQQKPVPEEVTMLSEWVKRLGLQDWAIVLKTKCHPSDMHMEDVCGCTLFDESTKAAEVQIVDPDLLETPIRTFNMEETLVHELLHLKLCLLQSGEEKDTLQDRVVHQIIDDLARAFANIKQEQKNE